MTKTDEQVTFAKSLLKKLQVRHEASGSELSFDDYLLRLPTARTPNSFWGGDEAKVRVELFAQYGLQQYFEFANVLNDELELLGSSVRLDGSFVGEDDADLYFLKS